MSKVSKNQFLEAIQKMSNIESVPDNEKVQCLTDIILYADEQYYLLDNPVLADIDYDNYFKELKKVETRLPDLIHPNSPTQRVAFGRNKNLPSVNHLQPMLSLENTFNEEDLINWDKKNKETLGLDSLTYTVEPKYDGAGVSILYENGRLSVAATRGDGIVGENITSNARQIRSIPLANSMGQEGVNQIEIRGEVVIKKETFEKINQQRIVEGLSPMANPRNAASGTLRMLDPEEVKKRGLFAIMYHVSHVNDFENENHPIHIGHYETINWLSNQQFATPINNMKVCRNIHEVIDYCKVFEDKRDELPYEIDGMVVKVNEYSLQDKLGMTAHHPRWAVAYKFKARQATSKLLDVEFQVGRTGIITPVAKIEPVYVGGVTISSISLFNEDVIKEKNLMIGDHVLVERAGDVIPYIVKSIESIRSGNEEEIRFPENCPVCNSPTVRLPEEAAYRCNNVDCAAQVVERMIHFASKDAMDIRNLGESNIRRFFELGYLNSVVDIYKLPFEKLVGLEKLGVKSIENLKTSIEKSKSQPLHRLIFALGIKFVGEATAKTLARNIDHIMSLKDWTVDKLCQLEDVGPKVANSIYDYFHQDHNIEVILQLGSLGLQLEKEQVEMNSIDTKFAGLTFLFTGTLSKLKRSDAEAQVEALGGKILSGVSSKLNYLVVGAEAGSKLEKAKKMSTIQILTEEDFVELLKK